MEPVLVTLDLDKEMRVETNTSDFATGGMLSMKYEDERWRPVAYISKSLNEAESVMGCLGHEQFLFYFILFSDFIGIFFSFLFGR